MMYCSNGCVSPKEHVDNNLILIGQSVPRIRTDPGKMLESLLERTKDTLTKEIMKRPICTCRRGRVENLFIPVCIKCVSKECRKRTVVLIVFGIPEFVAGVTGAVSIKCGICSVPWKFLACLILTYFRINYLSLFYTNLNKEGWK